MSKAKIACAIAIILLLGILTAITVFLLNNKTENNTLPEQKEVKAEYSAHLSDKVINNPYMGLTGYASNENTLLPVNLVYINATWAELEPQKGSIDLAAFETKYNFEYWKSKGVRVILRVNMDIPLKEKHKDIPEWLYNEINGDGEWYNTNGRMGFSPNYENETLKKNHNELIKMLAEKYGKDDIIAFVELGSIGHWGEWHTTYVDEKIKAFPKTNITDRYVKDYTDNFKNKILLMRRPFAIAKENNFGLYNDAFGDNLQTEDYFINWFTNGYTDKNTGELHPAMPDFWKYAPSGGDVAGYLDTGYFLSDRIDRTLKQLEDSHISFLMASSFIYELVSEELMNNMNKTLIKMGYRYSLIKNVYNSPEKGAELQGQLTVENKGISPFYYNWNMGLKLYDLKGGEAAKNDNISPLKTFYPGSMNIGYKIKTENLLSGKYKQYLFINNPLNEKEDIEFANTEFQKGLGVFAGDAVVKLKDGFECDSFENSNFYNYIDNTDGFFQINANKKSASQEGADEIKIYKNKTAKENWTLDYSIGKIDDSVSEITLMAGENILLYIKKQENQIQLQYGDLTKIYSNDNTFSLSAQAIKKGNNIALNLNINNIKEKTKTIVIKQNNADNINTVIKANIILTTNETNAGLGKLKIQR